MNIVILFIILGCCKSTYSRTPYGRTTYSHGSEVRKVTYKQKDVLSKDLEPLSPTEAIKPTNLHSYKIFNPKTKNVQRKAENISPSDDFKEPQFLTMEVGDNIIKASSSLHSDKFEKLRSKYSGKKFHHVVEIVQKNEEPEGTNSTSPAPPEDVFQTDEVTVSKTLIEDTEKASEIVESELILGENISQDEKVDDPITLRLGNESLFSESEGSGEAMFSSDYFENDADADKSGRLLSIFSRSNDTAPVCTTPKNETGRCRRFSRCLLSDALSNFNGFLQYLCLIRGARVGICCPDNPVIEVTNSDQNSTVSDVDKEIKQPPEGCGLNVKTRIVGGTISVPHEWSWMVALLRRNRFYCGGVIINNWYILTAAHCVLGINVKDLTVRLGEYNFSTRNEHEEDLSVAEIKRHAQFVTLTFQHDIALLKLQRSINYTKFVGSICLPAPSSRDYSDVKGTVVGWGTVSFGGAASPILRQVTIPIWKNEDCDKTYRLETINDAFLCAGSPEKGEDACQGDSGGPLMTLNDRGRWEVIGLVSWGRRCGDPTYPGVYTRITTYLDWINQNIS